MAFYSALGLISRRGCRTVPDWIYGSNCVSRSSSSMESVSAGRRMSPWLMQIKDEEENEINVVYKFFSLAENRLLSFNWGEGNCMDFDPNDDYDKLVGSSQGWLAMTNYGGYMGLINPLTRRHIKLPSRVTPSSSIPCLTATKIILSCSPDDPNEGGEECRAVISYGPQNLLAFCCPGWSSGWTRIGDAKLYKSVVYSKRQQLFFCSRRGAYLEAWDLRDPLSPKLKLTKIDDSSLDCRPRYDDEAILRYHTEDFLVINDDTDDLFLVRRFMDQEIYDGFCAGPFMVEKIYKSRRSYNYKDEIINFNVHRYDPESGAFTYVDRGSLDGLSFFISTIGNGFALSSKEFPELKPNSIYFTGDVLSPETTYYKAGIFNYLDATISTFSPWPSKYISGEPWWFIPNTSTNAN